MPQETMILMSSSRIKFGPGATREVGYDMRQSGARRVMVVTDPNLAAARRCACSLRCERRDWTWCCMITCGWSRLTPRSRSDPFRYHRPVRWVCCGGRRIGDGHGQSRQPVRDLSGGLPDLCERADWPGTAGARTAQAADRHPDDRRHGSETTGVAIFDLVERHVKTGIANNMLRPDLGIVDPNNTISLPRMVAACTGWDVLCHAIESLTALPYNQRPAPDNPGLRPAYQGANPISDVWAARAIEMVSGNLFGRFRIPRTTRRGARCSWRQLCGDRVRQRGRPSAARHVLSGVGRSAQLRGGGLSDGPRVGAAWHGGHSQRAGCVSLHRAGLSGRHLLAARLMGVDTSGARPEDAGDILATTIAGRCAARACRMAWLRWVTQPPMWTCSWLAHCRSTV